MKKILIIGTGGTIASAPSENGLAPELSSKQLIEQIPQIKNICEIECVEAFNLDSTNIRPAHWIILADIIKENYADFDGFVISHGTDTMAYSAAGISYLVQNSKKPIVFTGAQKPIGDINTDAKTNLTDAITYACDSQSHYVSLVFSGSVICGTRARKNFSKRFMAFGSINFPELARMQDGRVIRYINETYSGDVVFYDYINPNVGLIKLTPGINNDVLKFALKTYDALVIESYGVGGLPEYSDFYLQIKQAAKSGKFIVMTTQVPNEGSDLSVYRVGNVIKSEANIFEAHDMTSEAVLAKLMWTIAQTNNFKTAEKLFYKQINHDTLFA